jgi:hypothetical protein
VIRLSFGAGVVQSATALDVRIRELLRISGDALGITIPQALDTSGQFAALIRETHAAHGERVAVLVDEYANDFAALEQLFTAFFASIPHDWYRNNPIAEYEGKQRSVVGFEVESVD